MAVGYKACDIVAWHNKGVQGLLFGWPPGIMHNHNITKLTPHTLYSHYIASYLSRVMRKNKLEHFLSVWVICSAKYQAQWINSPAPGAWFITKSSHWPRLSPAQYSLTVQNNSLNHHHTFIQSMNRICVCCSLPPVHIATVLQQRFIWTRHDCNISQPATFLNPCCTTV